LIGDGNDPHDESDSVRERAEFGEKPFPAPEKKCATAKITPGYSG
jgi:hypothetical protein